jgi:hypothetical protein
MQYIYAALSGMATHPNRQFHFIFGRRSRIVTNIFYRLCRERTELLYFAQNAYHVVKQVKTEIIDRYQRTQYRHPTTRSFTV